MMRAVDTFTVIVPVCNVARYLAATMDSLLAQSIGDWRAICVDDGSTDGSGRILDEYVARDARITVIHQANRGVSAARNVALNHATGDILAFLDPDDLVAPDWLAKLKAGIRDVDLVWGGMTRDDGYSVLNETPLDIGVVYRGDAVRQRVWRAVFGYRLRDLAWMFPPGGMWRHCRREYAVLMCRAIRRIILNDLRFDERVRYGEDMLFWRPSRSVRSRCVLLATRAIIISSGRTVLRQWNCAIG